MALEIGVSKKDNVHFDLRASILVSSVVDNLRDDGKKLRYQYFFMHGLSIKRKNNDDTLRIPKRTITI